MLKADIDQLNKLASVLDGVGKDVDDIDVRTGAGLLADALPGCEISQACTQAGEFVEGAYLRVAARMRQVAAITTDCAQKFNTTDAEFARRMNEIDVTPVGRR
ncbi:hypothetical protein NONI108955_23445 [Nocardia ninae]|uniref:ESX-1 secretion-associated protein n=1 Tax=Nocardia ninae NBRC 108245 TaxID=1210091 RepID=A0A511MGY5_9NOCA|nr:hypothetical protein [Nocardia ninae]GEM39914.1 hypothetical protein NN4_44330 [Nocardia ninae NBRC 108245]